MRTNTSIFPTHTKEIISPIPMQFTIYISNIFLLICSPRGFEKTCGLLQAGENLREARGTVREMRRAGSWDKTKVK